MTKVKKNIQLPNVYYYPVIYAMYNRQFGKVYIGQTVNRPTDRWRYHLDLHSGMGFKIKQAVRDSKLTDWVFAVIDEVTFPADVTSAEDRAHFLNFIENQYIDLYDSLEYGYNSKYEFVPEDFIRTSDIIKKEKYDFMFSFIPERIRANHA